ncbi:MAG: MbcA/ParS/Xre antitoxin family protein [Candidatus Eremiobacteraeota bacterium]|nr:MbcA/ParS/Xre antitoxin family protein [Candidatus Eremiobacteraeota bacterium]
MAVQRKNRIAARTGSERLSRPALETFFHITDLWKLSAADRQKLLGVPSSTYFKYRASPGQARLQRDTLERVSYIIGIYKSINILLPRAEAADNWVRRANAVFHGRSALEVMLGGNVGDLYAVRHYLDGERGW